MHTTYTQKKKRKKKSLKNTKINYTKDLLRQCLLIFWEDFCVCVCVCVLQVSVLAKSVRHSFSTNLFVLFLSTLKCRPPVLILGGKKRTVMTFTGDWSPVRWIQTWFSMKQICFDQKKEEKKRKRMMSSVVEDKCFICIHTDFFLSSKTHASTALLSQHCTSFHVVSLYIPPGFTKQKDKNKR